MTAALPALPPLPPPPGWVDPRCAAICEAKHHRPNKYPTLADQRCNWSPAPGDPDGLCRTHRQLVDAGERRLHLVDGTSLPNPETGAPIIELTRDGTVRGLRCQAVSQVSGEQCKFQCPPGEVFCAHHTRRGGDPVLGNIESAEERREQLRAVRDALTFLCRLGLEEVQATLMDPHARRSDKLKATDIVLKLSVRSGLLTEIQETEDERELDAEILAIAESISSDAGVEEGGEARLIELAAAQGYEVEFIDDEKEAV